MNHPTKTSPKAPAAPARAAAPAGAKGDATAQRVLARLSFSAPIFGMGEYSWSFICDGAMAQELQQAMLDRKPYRLAFPGNTVVLDTAQIVLADFQPQG